MSNSFSSLNEEEEEDEEDVENVYDESANLIQNTKAGGSFNLSRLLADVATHSMMNRVYSSYGNRTDNSGRFHVENQPLHPQLDQHKENCKCLNHHHHKYSASRLQKKPVVGTSAVYSWCGICESPNQGMSRINIRLVNLLKRNK
ncbi:hypothetical protein Tco_1384762 [Tanacetum coccineum]